MIFQTERLLVRKLAEADFDSFHELQSDPSVMKFTTGKAQTLQENKADMEYVLDCYKQADPDLLVWAVVEKETQQFAGTAALAKTKNNEIEVGLRFMKQHWGKGYGSEALLALAKFGFQLFDVSELFGFVDTRNIGSVTILKRTGFRYKETRFNDEFKCEEHVYIFPKEALKL